MTMPSTFPSHDPQTHRRGEQPADPTWTAERIRALGLHTDIATAASIFRLSRAAAYDLAKRGQFPVAVLRFGTRYRVPVAAILHALHLPVAAEEDAEALAPPAT
jgi:hypothetical protein